MGPDDVTAAWLAERLEGEVGAVHTERIGDGLVGLNLRVELLDSAPELPGSVVLKLPSLDETSRATGILLRNYEREVKFYLQLADTVDLRVPHCHHGEWDEESGDFVLVLEDMAPAEQGDQVAGCSLAEAQTAVADLARLHGPRWNDEALHDVEWLGSRAASEDGLDVAALWTTVYPGFEMTFGRHLTAEALDLVRQFGPVVAQWIHGHSGPLAVTHGDFRLDNLLFGTAAGGPAVTTVDWQTPGHGHPVGDLSYFCGASLLPEDRRLHERDLLDLYASGLGEYGVDIGAVWLWEQYRRDAFAGVVMAVIASQIVGESARSEAMFAAMATRHLQHALDLDSLSLI
jgi:hypothetical protein